MVHIVIICILAQVGQNSNFLHISQSNMINKKYRNIQIAYHNAMGKTKHCPFIKTSNWQFEM
jgi:hypothetical protein